MDPNNKYTTMQRTYYDEEGTSGRMNVLNHSQHNSNPDYWNILVSDTLDNSFIEKTGLDFGCGCGRNVMNIGGSFAQMDGVDISPELVKTAAENLASIRIDSPRANFYTCDGISLSNIPCNQYDFLMSTITLQHICVYDIRYNYLREFYRVMKPGGLLSIQMAYGTGSNSARDYYENFYDAPGTNSRCDVRITNPEQIIKDLVDVGFTDVRYWIRPAYADLHTQWIYLKAYKPGGGDTDVMAL